MENMVHTIITVFLGCATMEDCIVKRRPHGFGVFPMSLMSLTAIQYTFYQEGTWRPGRLELRVTFCHMKLVVFETTMACWIFRHLTNHVFHLFVYVR